ncbi:MAG: hypothetical protein FJX77_11590, partial [Armatimonadetes bacterium]|nr:hypothetical protein [Armatimonadota bacterium]
MKAWEELTAAALLGTTRQAPPLPSGEGALPELLSGLSGENPEALLLNAAGVLGAYRRAGRLPYPLPATSRAAAPPLSANAAADLPLCRPAAALRLAQMLQSDETFLLGEWLQALGERGERVPEELLPALLACAAHREGLRTSLEKVAGAAGHWLAQQNPAWTFATEIVGAEDWSTAGRQLRRKILQERRREDPAAARELLSRTWKEEPADERSGLLELLEPELGPEDEPFLETALDDRSRQVRATAARLLSRLPDSALGRRMEERAALYIRRPAALWGRALQIEAPGQWNPDWSRDGMVEKTTYGRRTSERGWWLEQMVAATPIRFWTEVLGIQPDDLEREVRKSDWREAVVDGVTQAVLHQRHEAWAEVLLEKGKSAEHYPRLLTCLSPARLEARTLRLLHEGLVDPKKEDRILAGLEHHTTPWSEALGREVLLWLRERRGRARGQDWRVEHGLRQFAAALPRSLLADALRGWPEAEQQE